ncbi:MAG: ribbon-helix-helix protein, CopG family [Promethearchaeota archaeon]
MADDKSKNLRPGNQDHEKKHKHEKAEGRDKSKIISMSLNKPLLDKIDALQKERGFSSRSEAIRHCLLAYTKDIEKPPPEDAHGLFLISISYYTSVQRLLDLQNITKDFSSDILLNSRVRASETVTVTIFVLKTSYKFAKMLFEKLSGVKGLIDKIIFSLNIE